MLTKKVIKYFGSFGYEKEQEFLREMHKSGWKFVKVTGFVIYHFEQCEPQDVIYQTDYNKEGLKNKDDYIRMFADCGWEYVTKYYGYTCFRKPADKMNGEKEEIFSDYNSRLKVMKNSLVSYLVSVIMNFIILALWSAQFGFMLFGRGDVTMNTGGAFTTLVTLFILYIVFALICTALLIRGIVIYNKYKNKIRYK